MQTYKEYNDYKEANFLPNLTVLLLCLTFSGVSFANEIQKFIRCYGQLTQSYPEASNFYFNEVREGRKSGIESCLALLDDTSFTDGDLNPSSEEPEASYELLRNLHQLHTTWFLDQDFTETGNGTQNQSVQALYDKSSPASYFTKAFFDANTNADYVYRTDDYLVPSRETPNPDTSLNRKKPDFIFDGKMRFPDRGPILGIKTLTNDSTNWTYQFKAGNGKMFNGTVNTGRTLGAGVIGHQVYLQKTVNEAPNFRSDGGMKMPRKWARSALSDLLCRDLPMLRDEDVKDYIAPNSQITFRTSTGCVKCHTTMDQIASTLRNLRMRGLAAGNSTPKFGGLFFYLQGVNANPVNGWPATTTNNYDRTPPEGKLIFRNYKGELINQNLTDLSDLGQKLANLEDPYVCWAKRYYEYLTGISVEILDPGVNNASLDTGPIEEHRNLVYQMGRELKNHQDPKELLKSIIRSKAYSTVLFGSSGGNP